MSNLGARARASLAVVTTIAGLSISAGYPRVAAAAEFAQDFPKSYSLFVKMKPMQIMHMMDPEKRGYVTKEEFMSFHQGMFDRMDKNKDGRLSREEWLGQIHSAP